MSTSSMHGAPLDDDGEGEVRGEVDHELRWIAWVIIALIVVGAVVLAFVYQAGSNSSSAKDKASELVANLDQAGLETKGLDQDTLARVYGTDGGISCEIDRDSAVRVINLFNSRVGGEAGNGRAGSVDPRAVKYERAVLQTYCPERVDAFDDIVSDLRLRRTRDA